MCGLKPSRRLPDSWAQYVTPFVGVWIETFSSCFKFKIHASHPSWVCGLKPGSTFCSSPSLRVTPFVGVWIETSFALRCKHKQSGHTLRGCVDWNTPPEEKGKARLSHPSWVCGLKLTVEVANSYQFGHTLRGCVDWNMKKLFPLPEGPRSHPSWVCGLKPRNRTKSLLPKASHPSWVCGYKWVDKV